MAKFEKKNGVIRMGTFENVILFFEVPIYL